MDAEGLGGEARAALADDAVPLGVADRTEHTRRADVFVQAEALHRLRYEARPYLAPGQRSRVLRLADFPGEAHRLAAARGTNRAGADHVAAVLPRLAGEDVLVVGRERAQADLVHVDPPAAAVEQELVAKEVREAGDRIVLAIGEDPRARQDLVAVAHDRPLGHAVHAVVDVQPELVAVIEERADGELLHGREPRPDPEALNQIGHRSSSSQRRITSSTLKR